MLPGLPAKPHRIIPVIQQPEHGIRHAIHIVLTDQQAGCTVYNYLRNAGMLRRNDRQPCRRGLKHGNRRTLHITVIGCY